MAAQRLRTEALPSEKQEGMDFAVLSERSFAVHLYHGCMGDMTSAHTRCPQWSVARYGDIFPQGQP